MPANDINKTDILEDKEFMNWLKDKDIDYSKLTAQDMERYKKSYLDSMNGLKNDEDYYRLRSQFSDYEEVDITFLKAQYLQEHDKLSDDEIAKINDDRINVFDIVEKHEAEMSVSEKKQMNSEIIHDVVLNDNSLNKMPPKWLAKSYLELIDDYQKENNEDKKKEILQQLNSLSSRMDNLTDMMLADEHGDDLWYVDPTNAANTYDGYEKMFDARLSGTDKLNEDEQKKEQVKSNIEKARAINQKEIEAYDNDYDLKDVSEKDKKSLEDNFDKLNKNLKDVEISPDVLKMVANFKFLDKDGNVEPQFEKDGQPVESYTEGAKVAKDSKLVQVILLAKQEAIKTNLTAKSLPDKENLQTEVNELLPKILYAFHVNSQVQKGVQEHIDEYQNPQYLDAFIRDLQSADKPMEVSDEVFTIAKDKLTDANAGFAKRIEQKMGKSKSTLPMKLVRNLSAIDRFANVRFGNTPEEKKKAFRKEQAKSLLKNGLNAFLVSGAITVAGRAGDVAITALTGGTNHLCGAAIGVGFGTVMCINNVIKWRKNRKAEGKSTGIKAFFSDRNMVTTLATTTLAATALGLAVSGNLNAAKYVGISALALGSANGVINTWGKSKEAGTSKLEAIAWSVLGVGVNIGSAYAGRLAGNYAVDTINQHFQNNRIFQHEVVVQDPDKVEYTYKDGVVDRAHGTLNKWYAGHEDLLQQRVQQIEAYNAENGTNINPYRYLLAAHDAGAIAPDNMLLHNQYGPDVHSHGNHYVLTDSWGQQHGIESQCISDLAGSVVDGNVNITPESLQAFAQIDQHIGMYNQVGNIVNAPIQNDGVLDFNARNHDGTWVQDANGEAYTTYANHDGVMQENHIPQSHIELVPNEAFNGYGMVGLVGGSKLIQKLKDRIGSLKDKIIMPFKGKKMDPVPPHHDDPVPPYNPPHEDPVPPHHDEPEPKPISKLLLQEYEIVYGVKPGEKSYAQYYDRVEKERQQQHPDWNMDRFLLIRREEFDKAVYRTNDAKLKSDYLKHQMGYNPAIDRSGAEIVKEARQSLQQSNITPENYTERVTLSHFTKYMEHFAVKDEVCADGSRRSSLNPQFKKKYDDESKKGESIVVVTDLNAYLLGGKSLKDSQEKMTGKDFIHKMRNSKRSR